MVPNAQGTEEVVSRWATGVSLAGFTTCLLGLSWHEKLIFTCHKMLRLTWHERRKRNDRVDVSSTHIPAKQAHKSKHSMWLGSIKTRVHDNVWAHAACCWQGWLTQTCTYGTTWLSSMKTSYAWYCASTYCKLWTRVGQHIIVCKAHITSFPWWIAYFVAKSRLLKTMAVDSAESAAEPASSWRRSGPAFFICKRVANKDLRRPSSVPQRCMRSHKWHKRSVNYPYADLFAGHGMVWNSQAVCLPGSASQVLKLGSKWGHMTHQRILPLRTQANMYLAAHASCEFLAFLYVCAQEERGSWNASRLCKRKPCANECILLVELPQPAQNLLMFAVVLMLSRDPVWEV